jgi:hypothetical protein
MNFKKSSSNENVLPPLRSSGDGWTRRSFVQSLGSTALGAGLISNFPLTASAIETSGVKDFSEKIDRPRYRAIGWWLTFDDLTWPNPELMDKIRRRADQCAASGVNCCIVFGAHLRWDFMPLWERFHDELRFVADELHQRKILLFDHHSATIVHRPRSRDEALDIWRRNRHHVPFYPSREIAATWEFAGSHLNDWRMHDVETGAPVFVPAYTAEQFCMNHPGFRKAYAGYVKKLLADTGMDGLMSDDMIFYADWRACGCQFCRDRFKREYGHDLPPVSDLNFWGNRRSQAFRDWIKMRFQTPADFLTEVKKALPENFPLLTCCSSSDNYYLPSFGMSYQDFIQSCNHVMLEMVGQTPAIEGTWDERVPSQLLHLDIARKHSAPCFGLGYGFFPDTAFFIWAVNKFLGSDCWFSTVKGRLDASPTELAALADDSELVGEGFNWEKTHPELFRGDAETDTAIFFSRATRDFYSEIIGDYCSDYNASCLYLSRANLPCEVVTDIPAFGKTRCLILSSVMCLSLVQRRQLAEFLNAGGTVIATGPSGHCDEQGNPAAKPWLEEFGAAVELNEPERPGNFPPYKNSKAPVELTKCRVPESVQKKFRDGWLDLRVSQGRLLWRPERITNKNTGAAVTALLQSRAQNGVKLGGLPDGWMLRQYRDGSRLLIHALPGKVVTRLHPTLQNQMTKQRIVEKLSFTSLTGSMILKTPAGLKSVTLHSPDLSEPRAGEAQPTAGWSVNLHGVSRYFILECLL